MKRILTAGLAASLCTALLYTAGVAAVAAVSTQAKAADENAQWFVLRTETTSDCWTKKLIRMNNQYASGTANIAGGPYKTEDAAKAGLKSLQARGSCRIT